MAQGGGVAARTADLRPVRRFPAKEEGYGHGQTAEIQEQVDDGRAYVRGHEAVLPEGPEGKAGALRERLRLLPYRCRRKAGKPVCCGNGASAGSTKRQRQPWGEWITPGMGGIVRSLCHR